MMGPGMGYPGDGGMQGQFAGQGPMPGGDMMGGMGMGPGMGGPGPMGGPGMGMGMGGPGMGMGERIFPAVKLRGLPFDVSEDDLRMFLGCDPVDILMVRRDGRLSGEAYIVLSSPMQVELALSKNRSYLGRRYIEVFRTKKPDYYKAIVQEMMDGGGHHGGGYGGSMGHGMGYDQGYGGMGYHGGGGYGGAPPGVTPDASGTTILKLRGLPFQCSDEDIVRWFEDVQGITPLTNDSVFIVQEGGRPSGIAFVELATAQEASAAMVKHRQMMGNRYIEIFPANRGDLEKYRARGGY